MRWSRQYAFKMLIFQSILTGEDMFVYSLSITCGDCGTDVKKTGIRKPKTSEIKGFREICDDMAGSGNPFFLFLIIA